MSGVQSSQEPVANRIALLKKCLTRLEVLERYFPDLTIKASATRGDIYQSKSIWQQVDSIGIHQNNNVLKVMPFKTIELIDHDEDPLFNRLEYKIYTDPLEVTLLGYYWTGEGKGLGDYETRIQIQNYMNMLKTYSCTNNVLEKIENEIFSYLKRTIIKEPHRFKIENDHFLSEKLQTLITFS